MHDGKMSLLLARFGWFGLDEIRRFAQVVSLQLVLKRLVGGFRKHTLFLEDGQDTHRLNTTTDKNKVEKQNDTYFRSRFWQGIGLKFCRHCNR